MKHRKGHGVGFPSAQKVIIASSLIFLIIPSYPHSAHKPIVDSNSKRQFSSPQNVKMFNKTKRKSIEDKNL